MINERGEEITAPDRVNQIIHQPGGIEIRILGLKEDCSVTFKSPDGEFSFNDIPPETRFTFHDSPFMGFQHDIKDDKHIILIPPAKEWQEKEPALAILHDKGHAASQQDTEWVEKLERAREELRLELFLAEVDGLMLLSSDPVQRKRQQEAIDVLYQEERRASAYALWQISQLRKRGIDPIPHRKTLKELRDAIEEAFKTHVLPELVLTVNPKKPHLPIKSGF